MSRSVIDSQETARSPGAGRFSSGPPSFTGPTLYDPDFEHDACGMGFVASSKGESSHRIVELAVRALQNLTHRGAVSSDAASGDGAGITVQLPRDLLADDAAAMGLAPGELARLGVAMTFLPPAEAEASSARRVVESAVEEVGLTVLGWRVVPIDASVLGGLAARTLPRIEQLLFAVDGSPVDGLTRRTIYRARRRAERGLAGLGSGAYVVSMSADTVVYKGLMGAPELAEFYPDVADPRMVSSLALFHQRFATNTRPTWALAQPFRVIAHNGEINTLTGNRNWMRARERELSSAVWGDSISEVVPVITPVGSDTASLDEALDLLIHSGRDALEAMAILIPEAWENMPGMGPRLRAFYQYHACLGEPWDGPAAVAFTDGRFAAAVMDRNGLRPARYKITSDGLVVLASEVGVLDLEPDAVVEAGRLGPGEMIAVDTVAERFVTNREIKRELASRRPYQAWLHEHLRHLDRSRLGRAAPAAPPVVPSEALSGRHVLHGYTKEELSLVVQPMAERGKEAVGSMGDDTAPSVLEPGARTFYSYFRQRFAQVTNPAIDSIRERIVMSLDSYVGRRGSLLESRAEAARQVRLPSPILDDAELEALRDRTVTGMESVTLSAVFPPTGGAAGLESALDRLCREADEAVAGGCEILVLSDRGADESHAPVPMLLAVSTVHHHLIRSGRRMRVSLVAEAADARDVHHFACLIGFGASAVNPYLALQTVRASADDEELGETDQAAARYLAAADAGLLKIMSKMGISTVASYHGAQVFEALGIDGGLVDRCFPGTKSRIGGIGLSEVAADVTERHRAAFAGEGIDRGGWYKYRRNAEYHANEPPVWRALHASVADDGSRAEYERFAELVHGRPPTALRDLLELRSDRAPIPLKEVEPVESIVGRFQTGAMSLGALSAEAHEDIARAMNRLGAISNTGEGGEDPRRFAPGGEMRDANSRMKQVASGRFGVTPGYLAAATELEIKISQGSKPGEGGQLPGTKVSEYIATLRHVHPGTPLISPPPHHDIYSIEDIAQLISDLKVVNPTARVGVKLVAAEGVGTVAAGVAKAYADVIQISGADGGTGASPLSSVKYAGSPWELGLAETQQTLVRNGLRGRVTLATDGGLHTGRDVVKAALLGADRFGFGTAALIAIGCKMARQCHSNTCPVGIATQVEELRRKYFGTPEMLVRYFLHVADEVRALLASLGYERLDDVIGRADLLEQPEETGSHRWSGVRLDRLLATAPGEQRHATQERNDGPRRRLDDRIVAQAEPALSSGHTFRASYPIANTDRTVGGGLSGWIARQHGDRGLEAGAIQLRFDGSAGQSFGAWLVEGVHLELVGEANDYVGKGMGGGEIAIRPHEAAGSGLSTLAGNTVLYGATGGSLFVAGRVGERFAVRNSGATAVVEGVGMHGCEYMTRGVVVVLGPTGRNFGAGMSGGLAFVLDEQGILPSRLNPSLVAYEEVVDAAEIALLRGLIARHHERTASPRARSILSTWPRSLPLFWRVAPRRSASSLVARPDRRLPRSDGHPDYLDRPTSTPNP